MKKDDTKIPSVLGQRPSRTAQAMFQAKLKQENAMTALERVKLALRLGQKSPAPREPPKT